MAKIQTPAHLKREFECIYLVRTDVEDPAVDKLIEKYRAMVDGLGGKVVTLESWGRRKLAYPIGKQRTANYIHMGFFGAENIVAEIERSMRITEEVVRWLTVVKDRHVDPESRPATTEITRRQEPEAETESRPTESYRGASHESRPQKTEDKAEAEAQTDRR